MILIASAVSPSPPSLTSVIECAMRVSDNPGVPLTERNADGRLPKEWKVVIDWPSPGATHARISDSVIGAATPGKTFWANPGWFMVGSEVVESNFAYRSARYDVKILSLDAIEISAEYALSRDENGRASLASGYGVGACTPLVQIGG
jgi:hypothetical protein